MDLTGTSVPKDQNPTESGGWELQHMSKTEETGSPKISFQAGYPSAAAFPVKTLLLRSHSESRATWADIAPAE